MYTLTTKQKLAFQYFISVIRLTSVHHYFQNFGFATVCIFWEIGLFCVVIFLVCTHHSVSKTVDLTDAKLRAYEDHSFNVRILRIPISISCQNYLDDGGDGAAKRTRSLGEMF